MTDAHMLFDDVVSTTRSMRRLDPDRDVPDATIEQLIKVATYGPSGGNAQPVRWIVVRDRTTRERLGDIYRRASTDIFEPYRRLAAADPPDPIAKSVLHLVEHMGEAPVIVAPCTRGRDRAAPSPFPPPWDDPLLTAASTVWPCVQNFCLAARSVGLGTTPTVVHNILEDETAAALETPPDVAIWALIPVGHPLGRWGTPKRRPVAAVTYRDAWGSSWAAQ
jgi:nitroreductase